LRTPDLAAAAAFTALAVGSDFALTDIPNVKLVDPIVFSVAFVYGFRMGAYVGILSELIWGAVSPYGFGGYIIPFLVVGEVLYALAGWAAAKAWRGESAVLSSRSLYMGALLALCAFLWDFQTNAGTAFLSFWPQVTLQKVLATEAVGVPFMLAHEVSDLVTGSILCPVIILYASRMRGGRPVPAEPIRASSSL
jgi:hypothetical protein